MNARCPTDESGKIGQTGPARKTPVEIDSMDFAYFTVFAIGCGFMMALGTGFFGPSAGLIPIASGLIIAVVPSPQFFDMNTPSRRGNIVSFLKGYATTVTGATVFAGIATAMTVVLPNGRISEVITALVASAACLAVFPVMMKTLGSRE